MKKEIKERTISLLDERWLIANMKDARPQDMSYYSGCLKAIEFMGYDWFRDREGKHSIYSY